MGLIALTIRLFIFFVGLPFVSIYAALVMLAEDRDFHDGLMIMSRFGIWAITGEAR